MKKSGVSVFGMIGGIILGILAIVCIVAGCVGCSA